MYCYTYTKTAPEEHLSRWQQGGCVTIPHCHLYRSVDAGNRYGAGLIPVPPQCPLVITPKGEDLLEQGFMTVKEAEGDC